MFTPSLATLQKLPEQRDRAFIQSMEMSTFVMFFLGFAIAAVAEPTIGFVWSGKWDDAVPVAEVMAITATRPAVTIVVRAMLESRGLWRVTTALSCWDAIGIMATAAISAISDDSRNLGNASGGSDNGSGDAGNGGGNGSTGTTTSTGTN